MTTLLIDTKTMHPWHDISRMLNNARSLKVKAGGRIYEGEAMLESTDGHLVLSFAAKKKAKK